MAFIKLSTSIDNSPEVCFDLSLSIDLHKISTKGTHEEAIDGRKSGIIQLHEFVTWRAKHFGFWFKLSTKITSYDKPTLFTDEMIKGPFKYLKHNHRFIPKEDHGTLMIDEFYFQSPFGLLGKVVDQLLLKSYLKKFLLKRNDTIKTFAENGRWKQLLKA